MRQYLEACLQKITDMKDVKLQPCKHQQWGDYVSHVAFLMQGKVMLQAQSIAQKLEKYPWIEKVDVAPPGFINIKVQATLKYQILSDILLQKEKFGPKGPFKKACNGLEILSAYRRLCMVLAQIENFRQPQVVIMGLDRAEELQLLHMLEAYPRLTKRDDLEKFLHALVKLVNGYLNTIILLCEYLPQMQARIRLLEALKWVLHNGLIQLQLDCTESI